MTTEERPPDPYRLVLLGAGIFFVGMLAERAVAATNMVNLRNLVGGLDYCKNIFWPRTPVPPPEERPIRVPTAYGPPVPIDGPGEVPPPSWEQAESHGPGIKAQAMTQGEIDALATIQKYQEKKNSGIQADFSEAWMG